LRPSDQIGQVTSGSVALFDDCRSGQLQTVLRGPADILVKVGPDWQLTGEVRA